MRLNIEPPDLAQYQKEILYCDARFTITEASTKVGKTFSHSWWIYERAHLPWNEEGFNHWWVAPTYSQAKIAFNRIKKRVAKSGLYKINKSELTITTPIGSIMHFKTAKDPDALYGEDVYSVVFDEAPRAKYEAFVALRSTVTFTRGPIKMIGNFGGKSNWMHRLKIKTQDDPKYQYFKITAWDAVEAGILEREEIEQAQRDLSVFEFKQLYLAEEMEPEDMLCSYEAIDDLWTNTHTPKGDRWITADIASLGSDKFKVYVWEGMRIIDRQTYEKLAPDEITNVLKQTSEKFRVPRSCIIYDADGLGIFLKGYLRGAMPFHNGAAPIQKKKVIKLSNGKTKPAPKINYKNLKTQCAYLLAAQINKREMYFNCDMDVDDQATIIEELECLQSYELDNEGKIQILPKKKIKEMIGRSPDDLDAMIMRMYATINPKRTQPKSKVVRGR